MGVGGGGEETTGGGTIIPGAAAVKALSTFNRPPVDTLPVRVDKTSTLANNLDFKPAGVKLGLAACMRATAPATWGVAMLVPLL